MYRTTIYLAVVTAAVVAGTRARAATAADLFEKGVYTEETAGDLDKAISIYEKVIAEAKSAHVLAAKAQFRIGQCLLRQGKKAEATAAFEKLVASFPDQKELVDKARKLIPVSGGLPLGPVPWADGETLQLRMRLGAGLDLGAIVYVAQSANLDDRKIWRVGSRTLVTLSGQVGRSQVDADWETFRPIQSTFMMGPLGTYSTKYSPNQAVNTAEGPGKNASHKTELKQIVYDNEQTMDAMRRLPLAKGYKVTLPIYSPMGTEIEIPLEVQGTEKVKVPAGTFECYKIHLGLVDQMFWMATDPHRYLVKFSANSVDAELTEIGQVKPGETRTFDNASLGISLTAPSEWFFYETVKPADNIATAVYLLDPQMIARSEFTVAKTDDLEETQRKSPRAWAESLTVESAKIHKEFKIRKESWQERKIGGLPAVSVTADYTESKGKQTVYYTAVQAKTLSVKFVMTVPQEKFDDFRKQVEPILESLTVKSP